MEALIDRQEEAPMWDPSTQLRVVRKGERAPSYPAASSAPARTG
jgi:hypothetical protein